MSLKFRHGLSLIFLLSVNSFATEPPTDVEIIRAIIANHDVSLRSGAGCDNACPDSPHDCKTLADYFSRLVALLQGKDEEYGDVQVDVSRTLLKDQGNERTWDCWVVFFTWDPEKKFKE